MAYIKNSIQAVSYSKFRPSPPKELIEKTLDFLKEKVKRPLGHALDVGCGSGQSTEILAPYFRQVTGIDSSQEQLQNAKEKNINPNVSYRLGTAEMLDEPDNTVDLVTVGMALHWFNLDKFTAEVDRVLRPDGALAVYGYTLPQASANHICLAETMKSLFGNTLGQYIPDESKLAYFDGYRRQYSKFSFSSQPVLRFQFPLTKKNASIDDFVGYISTMSAFQNYLLEHGESDALAVLAGFRTRIAEQVKGSGNIQDIALNITFPYFLLLSRKDF